MDFVRPFHYITYRKFYIHYLIITIIDAPRVQDDVLVRHPAPFIAAADHHNNDSMPTETRMYLPIMNYEIYIYNT